MFLAFALPLQGRRYGTARSGGVSVKYKRRRSHRPLAVFALLSGSAVLVALYYSPKEEEERVQRPFNERWVEIAQSPEALHAALEKKYPPHPGKNRDTSFVGIEGMKEALRTGPSEGGGSLKKFKAWETNKNWEQICNAHYDWYIFPSDWEAAQKGYAYAVFEEQIEELKKDVTYVKDLDRALELFLAAEGWDLKKAKSHANGRKWSGYGLRFGKVVYSLIIWRRWKEYDSVRAFFQSFPEEKKEMVLVWAYPYLGYRRLSPS